MPVNQPKISGDPVQDSWAFETTRLVNDLEVRVDDLEDTEGEAGGASGASGAGAQSSGSIPIYNSTGTQLTTLQGISYDSDNAVVSLVGADLQPIEGGGGFTGTLITMEERSNTIPLNSFKALVAESSDFADFQTRVAALTGN